MPKTAVGLFEGPNLVDRVVREIEALGFPRREVHTLEEPPAFAVTGVMSFPRLDFDEGLRRGGALVFATGPDPRVEAATEIMNRHGALEIEETSGGEPQLPAVARASMTPSLDGPTLAGRIRQPGGGASFFVW